MTRAALFGAVMGLLLGGAILAVLALQLSVVDMPSEGQAMARPDVTDAETSDAESTDAGTVPAPPPSDRIVSPVAGPTETAPQQIARLTDVVDAALPPGLPQASDSGPPVPPGQSGLAEMAPSGESPSAVAGVLAAPPEDANAIRGFRTVVASSRHVPITPLQLELEAPAQRSDPAAVAERAVPALTLEPAVLAGLRMTAADAPVSLSGISASPSIASLGTPDPAPRSAEMNSVPVQAAVAQVLQTGPGPSAPRITTQAAAPKLVTEVAAPKAQPDRRTGSERGPMILWLVTDLPAGTVAPEWAVISDAPDGVAAVPPLDQPEALAGFAAELDGESAPDAVMLQRGRDWPAVLLAPVLNLAPLRKMPVLYPGGVPPETVALLQARAPRSMPVYGGFEAETPGASMDATLAVIAERARRDGLVVVQVPADPAMLEAVAAWRRGPGADLGTARLSDLFGG